MRSLAAALLASLLPLAALAQQPGMRAQVMIVESLADFERWAESGSGRPYSRDLREVPAGRPVHFPIVVTGLRPAPTDINLVADIEFFGPNGASLGVIQQCCRFSSRAGTPLQMAVLSNAATLVFGANDMRGTYSVLVSVADGAGRVTTREEFRFGAPAEVVQKPVPVEKPVAPARPAPAEKPAPVAKPAPAARPAPVARPEPAPPAPAAPSSAAEAPRLRMKAPEKNPGSDTDKRDCLALPTPAEIIKCAEKKR
jgi:hypothetical protein